MKLQFHNLDETRAWLEGLLQPQGPFFDADGVLRSAINVRTLSPFTAEWAKTQTQFTNPDEPWSDYVAGISYEDSWESFGEYLEYVTARYAVTGEKKLLDDARRVVRLVIDVYSEDNPVGLQEWEARKGFFRRLFGGRYATLPRPVLLGTDQMNPLMFGLLEAGALIEPPLQKELETVLVGMLDYYVRRNFAYEHRATAIYNIENSPLGLSYFLPALVWAHKVTGNGKYMRAYERLHQDFMYNPDYFLGAYEMPYIESIPAKEDRFLWIHNALRWTMWIPWLRQHAPNTRYYEFLFDEFLEFNTRLLRNTLPRGLGHDYDNLAPTSRRYPEEWLDQPVTPTGEVGCDGSDIYSVLTHACLPPLRRVREHAYFALAKPGAVDVSPVLQILRCCDSPDHFTYWYDPEDKVVPPQMRHRSHSLQAQFVCSWLAAYWRLRKLGTIQ